MNKFFTFQKTIENCTVKENVNKGIRNVCVVSRLTFFLKIIFFFLSVFLRRGHCSGRVNSNQFVICGIFRKINFFPGGGKGNGGGELRI